MLWQYCEDQVRKHDNLNIKIYLLMDANNFRIRVLNWILHIQYSLVITLS